MRGGNKKGEGAHLIFFQKNVTVSNKYCCS